MPELLEPGLLFTIGIIIGFLVCVVVGVAVLRRIVARRNPELAPLREPDVE